VILDSCGYTAVAYNGALRGFTLVKLIVGRDVGAGSCLIRCYNDRTKKLFSQLQNFVDYLQQNFISLNNEVNFTIAVTEMYPRIPWELVAYPFGSVQQILGTAGLHDGLVVSVCSHI
jgi:hypothetical protein